MILPDHLMCLELLVPFGLLKSYYYEYFVVEEGESSLPPIAT